MARIGRKPAQTSTRLRRGQTIVAERERMVSDSERQALRKKAKRKKVNAFLAIGFIIAIAVIVVMINWEHIFGSLATKPAPVVEKYAPSIQIEDESGSGLITQRMADYVGQLEQDLSDLHFKLTRAIIPAGKTREVDVYLEGREEFYKMNLDRGTAVSAEDTERMVRYLDEHDLHPTYVDLRVNGKAYYR